MTYNYRCYLHNLKTFPVDDKAKMARLASASQATIRKTNCLIHAPKVRKSKGKAPSLPSRKDAMTETRSIEVFLGNKGKKKKLENESKEQPRTVLHCLSFTSFTHHLSQRIISRCMKLCHALPSFHMGPSPATPAIKSSTRTIPAEKMSDLGQDGGSTKCWAPQG